MIILFGCIFFRLLREETISDVKALRRALYFVRKQHTLPGQALLHQTFRRFTPRATIIITITPLYIRFVSAHETLFFVRQLECRHQS